MPSSVSLPVLSSLARRPQWCRYNTPHHRAGVLTGFICHGHPHPGTKSRPGPPQAHSGHLCSLQPHLCILTVAVCSLALSPTWLKSHRPRSRHRAEFKHLSVYFQVQFPVRTKVVISKGKPHRLLTILVLPLPFINTEAETQGARRQSQSNARCQKGGKDFNKDIIYLFLIQSKLEEVKCL